VQEARADETLGLPDDLITKVREIADRLGESPREVIIAAVEHFTRIPEQQRRAVMRGVSIRRRQ